jgi:hypothetical protein
MKPYENMRKLREYKDRRTGVTITLGGIPYHVPVGVVGGNWSVNNTSGTITFTSGLPSTFVQLTTGP